MPDVNRTQVKINYCWYENFSSRDDVSLKRVNMGFAHVMNSIITILSKITAVVSDEKINQKATKLWQGAINFVFNNLLANNPKGSALPSFIDNGIKDKGSRLAWCYGDLGSFGAIYLNFLKAKGLQITKSEKRIIENKLLELLTNTTKRQSIEETGVVDACLCHGSAGLSMIYSSPYSVTKNANFKETADFWTDKTLGYAEHEDGLAGYITLHPDGHKQDISFLTGISGIGLELLEAKNYRKIILC